MHYFIMKVQNKEELQQILFNNLSKIDFKDFMNLYKKCTAKLYYFQLLMLLLHQIINWLEKESFKKDRKTNHNN